MHCTKHLRSVHFSSTPAFDSLKMKSAKIFHKQTTLIRFDECSAYHYHPRFLSNNHLDFYMGSKKIQMFYSWLFKVFLLVFCFIPCSSNNPFFYLPSFFLPQLFFLSFFHSSLFDGSYWSFLPTHQLHTRSIRYLRSTASSIHLHHHHHHHHRGNVLYVVTIYYCFQNPTTTHLDEKFPRR